MSRIGLKFSQMILHTSTSKMMNNLPFLLVVLHKPTLWPSTFKKICIIWGNAESVKKKKKKKKKKKNEIVEKLYKSPISIRVT